MHTHIHTNTHTHTHHTHQNLTHHTHTTLSPSLPHTPTPSHPPARSPPPCHHSTPPAAVTRCPEMSRDVPKWAGPRVVVSVARRVPGSGKLLSLTQAVSQLITSVTWAVALLGMCHCCFLRNVSPSTRLMTRELSHTSMGILRPRAQTLQSKGAVLWLDDSAHQKVRSSRTTAKCDRQWISKI